MMFSERHDTYQNPVFASSCPDPFVLKFKSEYWAYCTGIVKGELAFPILHSLDLIHWQEVGGALSLPETPNTCYWAPEVTYEEGRFYLYYSTGNEETMHIRVAAAEAPSGPFIDSGSVLTREQFAIDPHVFVDTDGTRYLFYATDYLDYERVGTGTAFDRLVDPFTLAGSPQPVTRARYDWQIFDPRRLEKGGVRWHTVEGSFVLKRKGIYYHMFSGGNWKNITYGVGYAKATSILGDAEWDQACDGNRSLPILRTIQEQGIIGPGHNSVVRGPDNRQLFCIYHRWNEDPKSKDLERVLALDRLDWIGDRLTVLGPTSQPQPAPVQPMKSGFHQTDGREGSRLGPEWLCPYGDWSVQGREAVQSLPYPGRVSEARFGLPSQNFLLEIGIRSLDRELRSPGAFGLILDGETDEVFSLVILPPTVAGGRVTGIITQNTSDQRTEYALHFPDSYRADVHHLIRVEVNHLYLTLSIDNIPYWRRALSQPVTRLALFTRGMAAAFGPFELAPGYDDLFSHPDLPRIGWNPGFGQEWEVSDQCLIQKDTTLESAWISKVQPVHAGERFELTINARLDSQSPGGSYGFSPCALSRVKVNSPQITVNQAASGRWVLTSSLGNENGETLLPEGFEAQDFQQFRFWKEGERLKVGLVIQDGIEWLGEFPCPGECDQVIIHTSRAAASFDQVRLSVFAA